jgi:hypothetical protein
MCTRENGPQFARVKELGSKAKGQITNNYLHFENIRQAAIAGDFTLIRIEYYRNEELLAAKVENNQGRRNFIALAVALLKERHPAEIDQEELLQIWSALPEDERRSITTASARARERGTGTGTGTGTGREGEV